MSVRVVPLLTATSLGHHWPRALGSPRNLSLCISPIPRIFYTSRISLPDRSSSSSSQDHFFWDHFFRLLKAPLFYCLLGFVSYLIHYQNNPLIIFLLKDVSYDQLSSWCNNVFKMLLADMYVLYTRGISATHKHCSTLILAELQDTIYPLLTHSMHYI